VSAVKEIISGGNTIKKHSPRDMDLVSARVIDAADKLGIDKSSASRRVKQAIKLGYLKNED
jgi:DNA-binding MarR family transcriptional regulator